jgi:hypothetical protein
MSENMDTESFSCLSRAPGASQADGQNNGEDRQQSQAALQLADKGLELVKFNNNILPIYVAYDRAVAYVEAGKGNCRRTNMKIQDSGVFAFQLSCATCLRLGMYRVRSTSIGPVPYTIYTRYIRIFPYNLIGNLT